MGKDCWRGRIRYFDSDALADGVTKAEDGLPDGDGYDVLL
jgi:hypothetical protein